VKAHCHPAREEPVDLPIRRPRGIGTRHFWKDFSLRLAARFYENAARHARTIRNRYTFLDLAADAGVLERMIPAITRRLPQQLSTLTASHI
jgi:hypothetical protein